MEESKSDKVKHVKSASQIRNHTCHWPGCNQQVPPAMWGCYKHWMKLPKTLRDRIWNSYRINQETTLSPSREYLSVALEIQLWIREKYPNG